MDPAKRICLKNLPEGCTKRELAEMIKTRTGAQPHSIDLGLDGEGAVRRYAHFSCEGAKKVLDVMGSGIVLRDATVHAYPARMHYSFRYAEARRKREREDEEEKSALEQFWATQRERFLARTNNGELSTKDKLPRDFYFSRRKYGAIASEIADKLRKAHKSGASAGEGGAATATDQSHEAAAGGGAPRGRGRGRGRGNPDPRGRSHPHVDVLAPLEPHQRYLQPPAPQVAAEAVEQDSAAGASAVASGGEGHEVNHAARKRGERPPLKKHKKAKVEKEVAPPPSPPPPQPSKEERKLTGLQAKLAALKEKMKKK